jgi:hypothetical protein
VLAASVGAANRIDIRELTMSVPGTWRGVVKRFHQAGKDIQKYFRHVPSLAEQFPWDVCLSYMFSRVEQAQNMTLYCGLVKLHRADAVLTRKALDSFEMRRHEFREAFSTVFGRPVQKSIVTDWGKAEKVRDRVMHGKYVPEADKRMAVVAVLDYAEAFNSFVGRTAGFRPFGDLRGFKGRAEPLDKSTTRWLLKGMGFPLD